jgi:hypothetical protein
MFKRNSKPAPVRTPMPANFMRQIKAPVIAGAPGSLRGKGQTVDPTLRSK